MAEENNAQETGEQTAFSKEDFDAAVSKAVEEATGGLRAKVDQLLGEKKAAATKAREAEEAAQKAAEEAARKAGDTKALEESWQAKLASVEDGYKGQIEALTGSVRALTVGATAKDIAAALAVQGSAPVLERIARDRLDVEMTDEGPKLRVLDAAGKPSALGLDDLKKELASDPALAPLIAGTKASGGGAAGASGGAAGEKTVTREQWDKMSHTERAAFSKSGGKVKDAA